MQKTNLIKNMNKNKRPWYEEESGYFGPGYMDECGPDLTTKRTQLEVDFLCDVLALDEKSEILDCPCGFGRHSISLAKLGYKVTGVDVNKYFLEKARFLAQENLIKADWVCSDMRNLPFKNRFSSAINLFSSFGYFDLIEDDVISLRQIWESLKPGGSFVLDVVNRESVLQNFKNKDWFKTPSGIYILSEKQYDPESKKILENRFRISQSGQTENFSISIRIYSLEELLSIFQEVGFRVTGTYGGYRKTEFSPDSRRIILTAQKV